MEIVGRSSARVFWKPAIFNFSSYLCKKNKAEQETNKKEKYKESESEKKSIRSKGDVEDRFDSRSANCAG